MSEKEPHSAGEDLDVTLYRLILPKVAGRYAQLQRETKAALQEARDRHKRTLSQLRRRNARPERLQEAQEEYGRDVSRHKAEFERRLNLLLDEVLGERPEPYAAGRPSAGRQPAEFDQLVLPVAVAVEEAAEEGTRRVDRAEVRGPVQKGAGVAVLRHVE
jgi:hypothetical protein